MKKFSLVIGMTVLLALQTQAFAIGYYQNKGGTITKIDKGAFDACTNIIFRQAAKEELSAEQRRSLVSAMLKGETVNELSAAVAALKRIPGACSYGTDSEKFE